MIGRAMLLLFLALFPVPVAAEVAGARDPDLQQAVALWLAGDEETALPAMARLARTQDNPAAQILLSLIDTNAAFQGRWLKALPRAERIALMRRPGGLSGQSWLDVAQDPLADLWRGLWDTRATPEIVLGFAATGEHRAATFAARTLKRRQNRDLAARLSEPDVPAYLSRFGYAPRKADAADWAPVQAVCAVMCPEAAQICEEIAAGALQGDPHLAGPSSEQIIPPSIWAQSARARGALVHQIMVSGKSRALPACLKDAAGQ